LRDDSFHTSIGEGHTIAILLALRESGTPVILKDLLPIINHTQTLRCRLDDMEEEGLVNILVVREGHKHVDVWLTEMGKDIALMFAMADMLVSPEKDISEKSLDLRHSDTILRTLLGREYVVQKELVGRIPSYDAVIRALSLMEEEGLVTRTDCRVGGREIRYSLTAVGRQVAEVYQSAFEKIELLRRPTETDLRGAFHRSWAVRSLTHRFSA